TGEPRSPRSFLSRSCTVTSNATSPNAKTYQLSEINVKMAVPARIVTIFAGNPHFVMGVTTLARLVLKGTSILLLMLMNPLLHHLMQKIIKKIRWYATPTAMTAFQTLARLVLKGTGILLLMLMNPLLHHLMQKIIKKIRWYATPTAMTAFQ